MTHSTENQSSYPDGSLTGQLLVAMPGLIDPSFSGTLSLICEHNDEGAIGFIINQPLEIDLATVLEQIGLDVSDKLKRQAKKHRVLSGGPVSVERGFVVHRNTDANWQSSMKVSDEIRVTTSDDIIQAMAEDKAPSGATLILGYAGWAQGQLEQELLENSWLTLPASSNVVFDTEFEQRLKIATLSAGIDFTRMSSEAGHA